jgi:raffinose/stachyose/melibiose transport system substrate-binding protein
MKTLTKLALALTATTALGVGTTFAADNVFKVWWYEPADSALGIAWDAAIVKFEEMYPDVEVQFELKVFEQINQAGAMIFNSAEAPDLTEYNKGNGTAGLIASQGLLSPLDDVYHERGWDKIISEASLGLGKYDELGVFGSGPLIGIPNYGEFVSVYYNEDMLKANGFDVPTTFDEFTEQMDAFVAQGVTPISLGAIEYPGQHLFYTLALNHADDAWIANYEGVKQPLDVAPLVAGAKDLQDWIAKGYISTDANGMNPDDMVNLFEAQGAPYMFGGSWLATRIGNIETFTAGQFLVPEYKYAPGSTGNMWVVPVNAKNKQAAYDFIEITLSPEIQNLMGNEAGLPIAANSDELTNPIGRMTTGLFGELVARGGLGYYPDWPVPGFYNELTQAIQAVIGGTATPEEFGARLKKFYDDARDMM